MMLQIRRRFYKGVMASTRRNHMKKYEVFFRYNAFEMRREFGRKPNSPMWRYRVRETDIKD
jgi:hypothetical protein